MVHRIFYILALSILVIGSGQAPAATIDFEDMYAAQGEVNDPATYYQSSFGVTFGGTYWGVIGGVTNGDAGNWDLEGTNGPSSLADGDDGGYAAKLLPYSFGQQAGGCAGQETGCRLVGF